jgi:methyl-accepting chemotaxis protein
LLALKDAKRFSEIISDIKIGETGYAYIINTEGRIVAHKDINKVIAKENLLEQSKKDNQKKLKTIVEQMVERKAGSGKYTYKGIEKMIGYSPIDKTNWSIGISVPNGEILSGLDAMKKSILTISLIILLGSIICIYFIGSSMSKPIMFATAHANKMANGDFTNNLPTKFLNKKDEIGELSKSFDKMTNNFRSLIGGMLESSQQVATSSEELTATSQQATVASEEVAKTIEEIAKGANDQAIDTEKGFEKANELGNIIEEEQGHIVVVNDSASKVVQLIDEGLMAVNELTENTNKNENASQDIFNIIMKTNESSSKIGEASNLITSIAEQTNLLALNAAIEAARAGEHGKGFAVVAEEIRKLAEQSTQSTKEIDNMVNELVENASNAVQTMEIVSSIVKEQIKSAKETELKYKEIASAIENTENSIETLSISGKEMEQKKVEIIDVIKNLSSIAQQNADGTKEVSAITEEQAASMEEIANASEGLSNIAQGLQDVISKFKI